jgi:D-glycero-D-manno-heptose 1,7-bisphosphate phosphatase
VKSLATAHGRPAVFLDRDGTMIVDVGYLRRVEDIEFYPWTIDAIRALNQAGLPVVVVTNQSGIARGLLTESILQDVHRVIDETLSAGGAAIAGYYHCPHHAKGTVAEYSIECDCRKPLPGLVDRAVRELNLDPARSFVVGDKWMDVALGRAVGARALLVRTGEGAAESLRPPAGLEADAIVDNLAGAASWILRHVQC